MSKRELDELEMQGRSLPGESRLRQQKAGDAASEKEGGDAAGEFAFGVTVEQIDALNLLIPVISAHGDVLAVSDTAKLANHTVPLLGQAIVDAAAEVSGLLEQVEAQQIGQGASARPVAREARGMYAVRRRGPGRLPVPIRAAIH